MGSKRLNRKQADDVLSGRRPVRRGVPEGVEHVVAVLHASRELEPPPPMSQELRAQLHGARPPVADPVVPRPGDEVTGVVVRTAGLRSARRAVASMAAAAALLVGVVLAATLPDGKAGRSDVGDTPTPAPAPASDSTTSTPAKVKGDIADPATADTPPETGPEADAPASTAPADAAPEATEPPAAPAPGDESGDRRDDGDRDGDGDGRDDFRSGPDGYREDATDTAGDDDGVPETAPTSSPSTTSPPDTTTTTTWPDRDSTTTTTTPSWGDDWWWNLDDAFRPG